MDYLSISKKIKKLRGELSVKSFSKKVGISAMAITYYESNDVDHRPKIETLKKISEAMGIDIGYFLDEMTGKEKPKQSIYEIPIVLNVAAGVHDIFETTTNPKILLPFKGTKNCVGFVVEGDSMDPLHRDGDVLIVKDRGQSLPRDGHTYVVEWDEDGKRMFSVKTLYKNENGYLLASRNPKHKPRQVETIHRTFKIIWKIIKFQDDSD